MSGTLEVEYIVLNTFDLGYMDAYCRLFWEIKKMMV
jgi:hypothetical protein